VAAVLLIDGLDELDPLSRRVVESELRDLALAQGKHRLFLTCRTAEYKLNLKKVQPFTLLPLSSEKITAFAQQWLGVAKGDDFLRAVASNPYAGTEVVPLTLAHLCAIYERDGALPPRPIDVYEAIVSMLLEQWDRERGVSRVSRYTDFIPRKKERFLQAVAFELALDGRKGGFRHDDLRRVYQRIQSAFGLPDEDEEAVILEVESHTGLILQTGYRHYEFVHLVIQEFLTAMHAQRTPNGINFLVPAFPNEMALVAAYSTNADDYLEEVLKLLFPLAMEDQTHRFIAAFVARLSIENVALRPTARNGWVLLGYLDLFASHRSTGSGTLPRVSPDEAHFFFNENSRRAVALAVAEAEIIIRPAGIRIHANDNAQIPEFMRLAVQGNGLMVRHEGALSHALPSELLKFPTRGSLGMKP
jgi:hypothetical protein